MWQPRRTWPLMKPGLRPLLRAVQQTNYFNVPRLQAVNHHKGRTADHQFAGCCHAPRSSHLGVCQQHVYLPLDLFVLPYGGQRIVLRNVVQLLQPVALRQGQPAYVQVFCPPSACARLSHCARRSALWAITALLSSQTVAGSSASCKPCATSARNHLS